MCLGVPAQIVDFEKAAQRIATVSISGVNREISVDLMSGETLDVGDWVLVHVGFALAKIDAAEAAATLDQIKKLGGDTFESELDSFATSAIS
ncbi:HypC/HybG/HupF family hydrogenase formation chaperone [Mobiluncus mulieris]|uniref:Hydrogenase assembly chaperone HypC/HupF n=2 Tax=Mobiluncus mulieris TaxID=2052 RepID=E0QMT4_9ACTO|nr:HypC/HybG/HupF family hydrogenase formation chaperone [Mobiluncus mulieris]EEJ53167.1 hydrogenase assembly chaperone HypC/HupF [Mobiluncus mulieris ATCC 35243]EEZ92350.1 hydrogenase assembly chaperone HypC/HupF [Mobiluncus mulieris 28-1]EFM47101.1 hydrogenase assembly chaperone HypC/HupF [Mobiluncus mulieris ATCC 35239]EFN93607.1 hydrogenase assembly chaperone HypC/HupF [Mobiluncus mulieris FB024-16]MBB5847348.1 hydrogenase expression/formation protein HypC [Mobiluncus mulieris]